MKTDPRSLTIARKAAVPGERVLWAGQAPRWLWPGHAVWAVSGKLIVFASVPVWMWFQQGDALRAGVMMLLGGAAALLAAMLALVLWLDDRHRPRVQAVTDRRVMLIDRRGAVRAWVGLDRAHEFRRVGRSLHLGGEKQAYEDGRTDLDGGLARFDALPKLKGLADPEGVLALIRKAASGAA